MLVDKLCWVCPGAVTTQDLVNDDDIRLVRLMYTSGSPLEAFFWIEGGVSGKIWLRIG